jgi:hypothetical protein
MPHYFADLLDVAYSSDSCCSRDVLSLSEAVYVPKMEMVLSHEILGVRAQGLLSYYTCSLGTGHENRFYIPYR